MILPRAGVGKGSLTRKLRYGTARSAGGPGKSGAFVVIMIPVATEYGAGIRESRIIGMQRLAAWGKQNVDQVYLEI